MATSCSVIDVHVKNLRKMGYDSLEAWLAADPQRHVYIGRHLQWVPGATKSCWANPFSVKKHTREGALKLYREYIEGHPELLEKLEELRGCVLGCWCHPEPCHGHVLQALVEARKGV